MIGCKLWTCESDEDWIYLQSGGRFFRFVIEPCKMDWICYDENLYLLEAHHYAATWQTRISGVDSSILPPDYVSLGLVRYEQIYRVPTKEMCSNNIGILNKEVFYNPQEDRVLYLAIPAGLAGKDGVPITRYDIYIKTADKSDWLKRGDGSFVLT